MWSMMCGSDLSNEEWHIGCWHFPLSILSDPLLWISLRGDTTGSVRQYAWNNVLTARWTPCFVSLYHVWISMNFICKFGLWSESRSTFVGVNYQCVNGANTFTWKSFKKNLSCIYWSYCRSSVLQDIYPKCIKMCIINSIADSNEPLGHLRYIMSISLHIRLPGVRQAGFEHERCHRCPRLNFKLLVILRSMEFENNDVSMVVIMDLDLNSKYSNNLRTNCSKRRKFRMLPRDTPKGRCFSKFQYTKYALDSIWC